LLSRRTALVQPPPNYHFNDKFGCKDTKKIEKRHLFERKIVLLQTITNKYALFQSSCYKRISTDTPADNDSYRKYAVEEIER
jgi:hypothetical protein